MPIHDWTLVHAGIFHAFHLSWIAQLQGCLNRGLLPSSYYALAEQVVAGTGPDVLTLQLQDDALGSDGGSGAIALATSKPKARVYLQSDVDVYARRARHIAIRHVSDHHVVAMIEIVSPGNKSSQHAIRRFANKAVDVVQSGVHLLVIDLFPPSIRDPDGLHGLIWAELSAIEYHAPSEENLTLASYAAGTPIGAFVEPTIVGKQLIEMPLFLEPEYYVNVPLEETYENAFLDVPRHYRDLLNGKAL